MSTIKSKWSQLDQPLKIAIGAAAAIVTSSSS
jgi:hypothetical protein